jgi:hypothetical protein
VRCYCFITAHLVMAWSLSLQFLKFPDQTNAHTDLNYETNMRYSLFQGLLRDSFTLLYALFIISMGQSPSSAGKRVHISRNPKVHCRIHNSPPVNRIQNQFNRVHKSPLSLRPSKCYPPFPTSVFQSPTRFTLLQYALVRVSIRHFRAHYTFSPSRGLLLHNSTITVGQAVH